MKITRKGKTLFQLIHIPIAGFGLGMAIACVPTLISVAASRTAVLSCYRNEPGVVKAAKSGECKIKRKTWLPNSESIEFYGLDAIHSASVSDSEDSSFLNIVLRDGETVQMSGFSTNIEPNNRKIANRDAINQFLKDPNLASIKIKDGNPATFTSIGLGTLGGLIFLSTIVFSHISICRFDKATGRMSLTILGILGKSSMRYNLSEIIAVEVGVRADDDRISYSLQVIIRTADPIPLAFTNNSKDSEKRKLADSINAFLGVA